MENKIDLKEGSNEEENSYSGKKNVTGLKAWFTPKMMALNAIVAALYCVITIASFYASFGMVQFRVSEILNLLVFFNPAYTIGLTVGCLLSNAIGLGMQMAGPWDLLIGTAATFVGCLSMIPFKHLLTSSFMPVIVNAIVVGAELTWLMEVVTADLWWVAMGYVFLGEFVVIVLVGYPLYLLLGRKYKNLLKSLNATKNFDFKW